MDNHGAGAPVTHAHSGVTVEAAGPDDPRSPLVPYLPCPRCNRVGIWCVCTHPSPGTSGSNP